ncbi:dephospho-CoA kinase [Anaerotaenia torta]|uniref:dephospho-CoA kinase n=1 Tax=Anaerotaenia torta TaxID=433293 RepID=UPI003D1BB176
MKVIGLTGGIGSGKSLVARIMKEQYGAGILDTDGIAREQMEPGGASYQEVVDYFGQGILAKDGRIDRGRLSAVVFENKENRLKINEITHPKVLIKVREEIDRCRRRGGIAYLLIETALMIEAGYDFLCDEVWYVYAPEEQRRSWLKAERGYTEEKIDVIIGNQCTAEEFRSKFPKVIENTGDLQWLEQQVKTLLAEQE